MTTMRDADMPLLDRIEAAIRRVTSGSAQMRVPVEATDSDIVLADCRKEIERLTRCLHQANAGFEHFEREWYLRGDRIADLERQLAEAQKDARRYRWLREQHVGALLEEIPPLAPFTDACDALDAAIDAAMGCER